MHDEACVKINAEDKDNVELTAQTETYSGEMFD